MKPSLPLFSS